MSEHPNFELTFKLWNVAFIMKFFTYFHPLNLRKYAITMYRKILCLQILL